MSVPKAPKPPVVGVAERVEIPLSVERADQKDANLELVKKEAKLDAKLDATPATTTREQDRHSFGQRRINLVWETTQALIAIAVTGATLYVSASLALRNDGQAASFLLLSNAFFLVVGFYFGRTNHQKVGGVDLGR